MVEPRERRTRDSLRIFTAVFFGAIGIWIALIGIMALGGEPINPPVRSGTAVVSSCERSPAALWVLTFCNAEVNWDSPRRSIGSSPPQPAGPAHTRIQSVLDLSGSLRVDESSVSGGRGRPYPVTLPVDRSHWALGAGGLMMFIALMFFSFGGIGYLVGRKVDSLLPEPPEPVKDWRGVDRNPFGARRRTPRRKQRRKR